MPAVSFLNKTKRKWPPSTELGTQTWSFDDKRLPEMLFRYRARNYPETLNEDELAQWMEHCRDRLIQK